MKNDRITGRVDNSNIDLSKYSTKYNVKSTFSSRSTYFGIFKLFLLILIAIVLIRFLYAGTSTYTSSLSLLETLSNLPSVSTSFKAFSQKAIITADLGIFNFIRDFLNGFTNVWSILMWISGALIDVILFIGSFLGYLFV